MVPTDEIPGTSVYTKVISAAGINSANNADFSPSQLNGATMTLNDGSTNQNYVHSFTWEPTGNGHNHEEVVEATLTLLMRRNGGGNDHMNDLVTIVHSGGNVAGLYQQKVFLNSEDELMKSVCTDNINASKVWKINGIALSRLNDESCRRLSVCVGDDTKVISADLELKIRRNGHH